MLVTDSFSNNTLVKFWSLKFELNWPLRHQVGLLPDSKLLDLLDLALSAEAVSTITTMRELLDSGVEPLALVSQLGALITDILAGSFDVQRKTRKKGFFRRNFCK